MSPVYCKNCQWYDRHDTDWGSASWCEHPSNIRTGHNHAGPTTKYLSSPSVRNLNADCGDFVLKIGLWTRLKSLLFGVD